MDNMGRALMGTGCAKGEGRARQAATLIQEQAHEDANIIFGASIVEGMADMIKVSVIATGFNRSEQDAADLLRQASRQPLETSHAREVRMPLGARHEQSRHEQGRHEQARHERHEQTHVSVPAHAPRPPLRPATARVQHTTVRPAGPQVREQIVFPASPSDADWDVPAYQRRNSS
jgi:cell division protein FtsZ